jgi:hypothetical protein
MDGSGLELVSVADEREARRVGQVADLPDSWTRQLMVASSFGGLLACLHLRHAALSF